MSATGLVHKCPLCINTDRKFWALGFVAMGHERTHAVQQSTLSFDHFIGSQHQASRDFVPNRLRGPEIDD